MSHPIMAMEKAISARAASADREDGDLSADVDDLRRHGWLSACLPFGEGGQGWGTEPRGARAAVRMLRSLGRANLSVARLFEGHMNALKLVSLYAETPLRRETYAAVQDGSLLGVWGADDIGHPLALGCDGNSFRGAKRFASGLGLVDRAVVSLATDEGSQLLVVPVGIAERSNSDVWRMDGMQSTCSGRYDFGGLRFEPSMKLGKVGDYEREPHFEGGIWRYCAAQLGGAELLYARMRASLLARGRDNDPHQQSRLVLVATEIETARMWIERAATAVEAVGARPQTAVLALLARQATEESCRTVLRIVEEALGMEAHIAGSAIERMRRDLSLFVCQAQPDAKRSRAACALFRHDYSLELL